MDDLITWINEQINEAIEDHTNANGDIPKLMYEARILALTDMLVYVRGTQYETTEETEGD